MLTTAAEDSIALHYQPLADGRGAISGFEALMRWHHQQRGPISPEAFIPIFEQNGLILPLSRWALREACGSAAGWRRPLQVSLNLSIVQLQQEDLPCVVGALLGELDLAPARLELEVTEAALRVEPERAHEMLDGLSALGVHLALDDFGLGYFPTSFLTDFPFTRLKIDRQFITNIEGSASARSVVHMIVELAHSLDLVVAAKGVETPGQLTFLRDEGCDLMQGFLIGRPAPIGDFDAMTGNTAAVADSTGPQVKSWSEPGPALAKWSQHSPSQSNAIT